ncbi:MAG: hypothetical protein HPY57_16040 [Ignavibacteria bacterium]|nr:hypothetical protein [Ignavibacteria bacterium]
MIILTIFFILIAGIFKAIMDTLQFHFDKSIFINNNKNWWNPSISWKNKYKNNDPKQGPKFFGSTTFLVSLTDAWHFFQMLFLTSIFLGLVFYIPFFSVSYTWIFDFVIYRIIFSSSFNLFYDYLLRSKSSF